MADVALEQELKYFDDHRDELLRSHLGKFVVIKGDRLVGTFDTAQAAYEAGVSELGTESFLTKQVLPTDPVAHAPALFTGLTSLGA